MMKRVPIPTLAVALGLVAGAQSIAIAQGPDDPRWRSNMDAAAIPAFTLPDPLVRLNGTREGS